MENKKTIRKSLQYSPEFKRNLRLLAKKYRSIQSDVDPIIDQLEKGKVLGNKIPGVKFTVYKLRVKNSNIQKGKSSGYRIIYYLKSLENIILITIYSKLDQSDISPKQIRTIINDYEESN
ncbi:MAG: type II toxin-antitoxin system RelE/ParE family toxin [Bacteroidetes bacterium]|nr:type II toxin-antitoxin system RelE/ParE family toxin [Bacteroidota bacterium]